jgi:small-conductance mechanosensitive channel
VPELNIGSFNFSDTLWEGIYALSILLFFLLLDGIVYLVLHRIVGSLTRRLGNRFGERLINAITWPLLLLVLAQGLFLATTPITSLEPWSLQIRTGWSIIVIGLMAISGTRLIRESLSWYSRYVAPRKKSAVDPKLIPPFRRFLVLLIYVLAGMLILDQLNISISPLVAGLGIGGLAVALALQPTLSNFFAGTYLVSDNVISPGDYIELESGPRGYVVEVGWRSTRLRTSFNNLVVIPNSRLSDSIVTNYFGPTMEIGVLVESGVSYSSDLTQVERVSMEVATEVIRELPEAVAGSEPWFGYERFGDSNIEFWVWVEATSRVGSFVLKTALIKRLHQRFAQEGIEINYPVRKLIFPGIDDRLEPPSPTNRRTNEE